jgi:hypothetical protein
MSQVSETVLQQQCSQRSIGQFCSGGYIPSWWGVLVPAFSRGAPSPPTDAVAGAGGEWRQMDWFRFLMSSLIVYGALR